ncbi:MAG: hypothetical protein ACRCSF_13350, partial [Mycobacteriaceae bacterium]
QGGHSLTQLVQNGNIDTLVIEKIDGESIFNTANSEIQKVTAILKQLGFTLTPRGLRLRRG